MTCFYNCFMYISKGFVFYSCWVPSFIYVHKIKLWLLGLSIMERCCKLICCQWLPIVLSISALYILRLFKSIYYGHFHTYSEIASIIMNLFTHSPSMYPSSFTQVQLLTFCHYCFIYSTHHFCCWGILKQILDITFHSNTLACFSNS